MLDSRPEARGHAFEELARIGKKSAAALLEKPITTNIVDLQFK